ncbi:MAG: hypothetical protein Q4D96_09360 [Propionibacteriaceae bacterium]|nr:hypothetical protein [Propionibacteriaceae bacterium]
MATKRPVFDRMSAGRFAALRHLTGLSTEELADELGVNPRTVRSWGRGRDPIPERIEEEMNAILTRQGQVFDEILASGAPVIIPDNDPDHAGKPSGWWLGVAARVLAADPSRAVRWWDELTPTARALEWVLHDAGIEEVLCTAKPKAWSVQTPSYRVRLRHRKSRQELIDAAPSGEQPRLREIVETWYSSDYQGHDLDEHRMGAVWGDQTWQEWIEYHADRIGEQWEPVGLIPHPESGGGLIWPY